MWNYKKHCFIMALILSICCLASQAMAHFGVITPSDDIISQNDSKEITLEAKFIHPNELHYMEMEKPKQFGVLFDGKKTDLLATLTATKGKAPDQTEGYTFWKTNYKIRRPGVYTFYLEPTPYWEPAEDCYIIHYTKVCLTAFGQEEGWDEPVGLETEIIPLTRPFGLWTGNVFTGKVLVNGKPAPNTDVEIEYLNEYSEAANRIHPPSDPYVTQVVKTDANGVFTYAMPKSGWWGFAALNTSDKKIKGKDIEIGAVYWVKTIDIK
jgi:cobalt/nickel transport protein